MADKKDRSQEELAKLEAMDRKTIYVGAKAERDFWSQVDASDVDGEGHWIWLGAFNNKGHPIFTFDGETFGAHRLSWVLHHGQSHPSYSRMHRTCGDKRCVRPEHLRVNHRTYKQHLGKRARRRFTLLALEEATSRKPRLAADDMGPTPGQRRYDKIIERLESLENTVTMSNRTVVNHLSQHRDSLMDSVKYGPQIIEKIEEKMNELTSLVQGALARMEQVEKEPESTDPPLLRLVDETHEEPPESDSKKPKEPDQSDESNKQLDAALTKAFGHGPLSEEGIRSLRQVFQLAMVEADKDDTDPGQTFFRWVDQYRNMAVEGGTGPTPDGLYRAVTSGQVA